MSKIDDELREGVARVIAEGISDEAWKGIQKSVQQITIDIESDLDRRVRDSLAENLAWHVAQQAAGAVEAIIAGNGNLIRQYLGCQRDETGSYAIGYNGRSDGAYGKDDRQHSVIHERLFETGCVALRRAIFDAHRDLIIDERTRDLEDQVKSLVSEVNRLRRVIDERGTK